MKPFKYKPEYFEVEKLNSTDPHLINGWCTEAANSKLSSWRVNEIIEELMGALEFYAAMGKWDNDSVGHTAKAALERVRGMMGEGK